MLSFCEVRAVAVQAPLILCVDPRILAVAGLSLKNNTDSSVSNRVLFNSEKKKILHMHVEFFKPF